MNRRILLISNYFAPDNTIAAVRTTKVVKYLIRNGFYVEVVKEKREGEISDEILVRDVGQVKVLYAQNSTQYKIIQSIYERLFATIKKKRLDNLDNRKRVNVKTGKVEFYPYETAYPILGSLDYIMGQIKQWDLFRDVKQELREYDNFDYVFTSYGDSFCYFAGKYYNKHHKSTKWIFDIRDAIYRYKFVPDYVKIIPKRYEKYVWKNADCILGVSKAICRRIPTKFRKKVHCVTNGYDLDDRKEMDSTSLAVEKMNFVYTGSMYGGLMDLSIFFEALGYLVNQKKIDREKIAIHYAGKDSAYRIFKNQAKEHALDGLCVTHGKMNRKSSMELQQRADVLLAASYDYKNNEGGVITGKVLEYMSARKPIIAIITGDIINGELASIIRKTQIGIAYEESNHTEDFQSLCTYIEEQYCHYVKGEELIYIPNEKELRKYDYKNIVTRLIKIIDRI